MMNVWEIIGIILTLGILWYALPRTLSAFCLAIIARNADMAFIDSSQVSVSVISIAIIVGLIAGVVIDIKNIKALFK